MTLQDKYDDESLKTFILFLFVFETHFQVAGRRRHSGDDGGFGPPSQRVLKDSGEFGLSVEENKPINTAPQLRPHKVGGGGPAQTRQRRQT